MTRCVECKGAELRQVREPFKDAIPLTSGSDLDFLFDDVPQTLCGTCGERYIDDATLGRLEEQEARALVEGGIRDGAVFKFLRKIAGLKATELADLLGVTAVTVSHWENGHSQPDLADWATLGLLVEDYFAGRTTTLGRLRGLARTRAPKRKIHLSLKAANG
jgi:DNA-binding transcriptional regulator YiaG